jgi:hypothetical protein
MAHHAYTTAFMFQISIEQSKEIEDMACRSQDGGFHSHAIPLFMFQTLLR